MRPRNLPDNAVLLHIGPYKTGSTAIQAALAAARDDLDQYGVAYPGTWRRLIAPAHAVMEWSNRGHSVPPISVWQAFAKTVQDLPDHRVCVSTEDFGRLRSVDKINRIADDLGRDRIHVAVVARPFHRLLPSAWQERVKSHGTIRYSDWLHGVLGTDKRDESYQRFWRSNDLAGVFRAWRHAAPAERFHVVISNESDREYLLRIFEGLLGLPERFLQPQPAAANASLSANATELLRRFNERFEAGVWPADLYRRLIQDGLNIGFRAGPRDPRASSIPALPTWAVERVQQLTSDRIASLRDTGVVVHGDPETLRLPDSYQPADDADFDEPGTISIDPVVDGLMALLEAEERRSADQTAAAALAAMKTAARVPTANRSLGGVPASRLAAELARRGWRRVGRTIRRPGLRPTGR